jgi:hypothetical protein
MKRIMVITGVLATFLISSLTVLGQSQSRSDILKEIQTKRTELVALEKSFLEPSEEDRVRYAAFLDQPGTGLIRLLPREKFESDTFSKNPKSITMRGGGAYYSFTRNTQEYGYGSDISLEGGQLSTGFAGADYGMLTDLGDIPLDTVGAETPAVALFAAYQPPQQEQIVRKEAMRIAQGADLEGLPVKRSVPLKLNSTYLLRSFDFSSSDVLVAFKVVRIDSDGSATILWKLLKKFGKPKFIRAETVDIG